MSDYRDIPSINIKNEYPEKEFLSSSMDIKRQLSQSLGQSNSQGGILKPTSRRGSAIPKTDNEDEDDDDGNERKRKDNINDKIQELLSLLPPELFVEKVTSNSAVTDDIDISARNSGTKDGKPNKGQILTKSVEYIQHLQNVIDENNRKEVELLMKIKKLTAEDKSIGYTSAEMALGKIGVGPLSNEYFKTVLVQSANANKSLRKVLP